MSNELKLLFIVHYALLGHHHQNHDYGHQNGYGYGGNNQNDQGGKIE